METKQKPFPLKKGLSSYKMVIPEGVERKIREWCNLCPTVEWSGTLFYKATGSMENNDLIIEVIDFYVSDVGSAAYTEYDVKPEVVTYVCDHELFDCKTGLIHSHNQMNTFFSGTDNDTLVSEGSDTPHFVSLIVNNAGVYTAAITRRVCEKSYGEKEISYPTFDNNTTLSNIKEKYSTEETFIEAFPLDITIEGDNSLAITEKQRYDEIMQEKQRAKAVAPIFNKYGTPHYNSYSLQDTGIPQPTFFNNDGLSYYGDEKFFTENKESYQAKSVSDSKDKSKNNYSEKDIDDMIDPYIQDVMISKDSLDAFVGQLLYGSITMSAESFRKLDKNKWLFSGNMEKVFNKRFPKIADYETFIVGFIESIVWNFDDASLRKQGYTANELPVICAYNITKELFKYLKDKSHKYVDIIIKNLVDYIV